MAGITIEVDNATVLNTLQTLGEHIDDLSPLFGQIGEHLVESTQQRFARQESPDGEPWAPLSPKYQRRKPKNKERILVLDGLLKDFLSYNAGPQSLEVGTGLVYAATHQFGRDDIPARPFLGFDEADETEILLLLREYIDTAT